MLHRKQITLIFLLLSLGLVGCGNNRSFDSASWLKGDARLRGRMSEDLIKRKLLIGQPVDEAERVLGPADEVYARTLQYKIDLGWAFKDPKHYGLQVHLDEERYIREVKIVD